MDLINSINNNDVETSISLLNYININKPIHTHLTPLMLACKSGNIEIVKYLINKNADINYINKKGMTAIKYASMYKHYNIIKLLLEYNASIKLPICSWCLKKAKFMCQKCLNTCYCSIDCQKNDWGIHKRTNCL